METGNKLPNAAEIAAAFLAEAREQKAARETANARAAEMARRTKERCAERVAAILGEVSRGLSAVNIGFTWGPPNVHGVHDMHVGGRNKNTLVGIFKVDGYYDQEGQWKNDDVWAQTGDTGSVQFKEDAAAVAVIIEMAVKAYARWNL
jgi:hypothetical protein